MDWLPAELWERVLLYLDIPTIGLCVALTCRAMVEQVLVTTAFDCHDDKTKKKNYHHHHHPYLWQALAERKYGQRIVQATVKVYEEEEEEENTVGSFGKRKIPRNNNPYYNMLRDDNIRGGVLPTLYYPNICCCYYKRNRTDYFFACIVTCVKWDRAHDTLQVHVDARGESDLRRPETSGLWLESTRTGKAGLGIRRVQGFPCTQFINCLRTTAPSNNNDRTTIVRGHYKGVLIFNLANDMLTQDGVPGDSKYYFCYANGHHRSYHDYEDVCFFF